MCEHIRCKAYKAEVLDVLDTWYVWGQTDFRILHCLGHGKKRRGWPKKRWINNLKEDRETMNLNAVEARRLAASDPNDGSRFVMRLSDHVTPSPRHQVSQYHLQNVINFRSFSSNCLVVFLSSVNFVKVDYIFLFRVLMNLLIFVEHIALTNSLGFPLDVNRSATCSVCELYCMQYKGFIFINDYID